MRVLGYIGIMAVIVIMLILAVILLRGIGGEASLGTAGAKSGEQKAVESLNKGRDKDEDAIDTKSEIQDTVRDAYKK